MKVCRFLPEISEKLHNSMKFHAKLAIPRQTSNFCRKTGALNMTNISWRVQKNTIEFWCPQMLENMLLHLFSFFRHVCGICTNNLDIIELLCFVVWSFLLILMCLTRRVALSWVLSFQIWLELVIHNFAMLSCARSQKKMLQQWLVCTCMHISAALSEYLSVPLLWT